MHGCMDWTGLDWMDWTGMGCFSLALHLIVLSLFFSFVALFLFFFFFSSPFTTLPHFLTSSLPAFQPAYIIIMYVLLLPRKSEVVMRYTTLLFA